MPSKEDFVNAHAFIVDEMKKRGMDHFNEMVKPEEKEPEFVYLKDVEKAEPDRIILSDPLSSWTGKLASEGKGHDMDLHIGGNMLSRRGILAFADRLNEELYPATKKLIDLIVEPGTPYNTYLPNYRLVIEKIPLNERKKVIMEAKQSEQKLIKLDLGCGERKLEGYFGIDKQSFPGVDLIWDLENGIPFDSDSVDKIRTYHFLEHISNPIMIMNEIWRVLKDGGVLDFEVPSTKGEGAVADPTHVSEWNKLSFQFYVDDILRRTHSIYPKFKILELDEFEDKKWRTVYVKGKLQVVKKISREGIIEAKIEEVAKTLKPLQIFIPLKTSSGYAMQEYYDIETFIDKWAKGYLDRGKKIDSEIKFNGWRLVLQKASEKTLIYFEDSKKDRSSQFPDLIKELKLIDGDVILDTELGAIGIDGKVVARKDLAYWGKEKIITLFKFETPAGVKASLICHVFDLLYWKDQDLHDKLWEERRKLLEELFGKYDFKIFKLSPKNISSNKEQLLKDIKKVSKVEGSEGAVCKITDSDYPLTGQTPAWSKIKWIVEFKVQVIKRNSVKGSTTTFNYNVGYLSDGELTELGKTYNTTVKADEGDIFTISAQEIIPKLKDNKWQISAVVPGVRDLELGRKKPETAEEIIKRAYDAGILQVSPDVKDELKKAKLIEAFTEDWRAKYIIEEAKDEGEVGEFGNIDFKEGMDGESTAQIHIMGLTEDGMKKIKDNSKRIMTARNQGIAEFARVLKSIIKAGAHIDIRLMPSGTNFWEGGECFIGNIQGLDKIANYKTGDKLRFQWKQSRKEEKKTSIVRGPLVWLDMGIRAPEIFNPGEVGAFTNTYAALIRIDKFNWRMGTADEHYKEFLFKDRFFDGRWIFSFVPVGEGKRIWMMSKPQQQEMDSEKKKTKKD